MTHQDDGWLSPEVYIPLHLLEGALDDLASAMDYAAAGDLAAVQDHLIHPWTVIETAVQAAKQAEAPER